ncbi:MAG: CGGC domain-containing protein [Planctomycetota bacterium]|jgi:predicted metal-binding protein
MDLSQKDYVVIVQCEIVKERCPGYLCEKAFYERTGGFADYPQDKHYRMINLTCGGCCGRALHRKLTLLCRTLKKKEGIDKDKIIVQLSSCITKDNYHAPPCPHQDYLKTLIEKIGIDYREDTEINEKSEQRRSEGVYQDN